MKYAFTAIAMALAVSGCATIVDGTTQPIQISSNADGAKCSISQNGEMIIGLTAVPATHTIAKRPGNLIVACEAPGYEPTSTALMAGANPLSVVGHWPGMLVGAGMDSAAGGLVEYQNRAYVHMKKTPIL